MKRVVAVAVSGGRDSMALLHCAARMATPLDVRVVALHVHHGLQPQAGQWAHHIERTCARWASRGLHLGFAMRRLEGRPARGDSLEAWARAGRYRALADMARDEGASLILLAHHRADQAETFLLQALRGAGTAGLAAMPRQAMREGLTWARPWLNLPREALQAYARRHRIAYVDDPSNADARYARSRLRHDVMPGLLAAFPEAESAFAASAAESARAQVLLDEVGDDDLRHIVDDVAIVLRDWEALTAARRRNALRRWLHRQVGQRAGAAWLDRLMDEVAASSGPATWEVGGLRIHRYRGRLTVEEGGATPHAQVRPLSLSGAPEMLPLSVVPSGLGEAGMPRALLEGATWRSRRGDDRFQRAPGTPPRGLKKQFQLAAVPPWARTLPVLVAADGRLLYVPGLGTDARAMSEPGQPRVSLRWGGAPDATNSGQ
ncbi:MAG TPA: tRNA lysidine(34) synthetase TilS [Burkholderiaceae bacterium]|nr:tRNA lysidine(34) synthetase TilS [Burkholderiaceae bacterium]